MALSSSAWRQLVFGIGNLRWATLPSTSWIITKRVDLDVTVAPPSPTRDTVLDIVGDLFTNGCQLKKLLFY
jgi:hypothetical protein